MKRPKQIEKLNKRLSKLISQQKEKIDLYGFAEYDKRLRRWTMSLPGSLLVVTSELLDFLQTQVLKKKYEEDFKRLYRTTAAAINEIQKNPNSRRLVILNTSEYLNTYQCFNLFQIVRTQRGDGEYDMYVYQRSSDLKKLKDDLISFAKYIQVFSHDTKIEITKLVVIFGHSHYELRR